MFNIPHSYPNMLWADRIINYVILLYIYGLWMFIVKIIIQVKSMFSECFQAHGKKETQLKL
jgi:hypothetical protein